jgi:hypothetical protein
VTPFIYPSSWIVPLVVWTFQSVGGIDIAASDKSIACRVNAEIHMDRII